MIHPGRLAGLPCRSESFNSSRTTGETDGTGKKKRERAKRNYFEEMKGPPPETFLSGLSIQVWSDNADWVTL